MVLGGGDLGLAAQPYSVIIVCWRLWIGLALGRSSVNTCNLMTNSRDGLSLSSL